MRQLMATQPDRRPYTPEKGYGPVTDVSALAKRVIAEGRGPSPLHILTRKGYVERQIHSHLQFFSRLGLYEMLQQIGSEYYGDNHAIKYNFGRVQNPSFPRTAPERNVISGFSLHPYNEGLSSLNPAVYVGFITSDLDRSHV
jgi:hypothetical protein